MNPVRAAIAEVLEGSGELETLAPGGVHWREAPQGTEPPLVIFQKYTGTRTWTFDGPPMREERYVVKGVGFADDAEDIDELCQQLLTDAELVVSGRLLLLKPLPDEDVSYGEDTTGEQVDHAGTVYKIVTERASS